MTASPDPSASSRADSPHTAVIVVAAGSGTRLGRDEPKAFVLLHGRSLLAHTLDAVFAMRHTPQVIVVVPTGYQAVTRELIRSIGGVDDAALYVVDGGDTRQVSVSAGLALLVPSVETVLIHDAARSLTPSLLFDAVVAEVVRTGSAVVPGLPVSDTIKRVAEGGTVLDTVDRSDLAAVQTPQGFPREQIETAHATASGRQTRDFTDDTAVVAADGHAVTVIAGDPLAFKITTESDLTRAEQLLGAVAPAPTVRVGVGTDVHAFDETSELWLAGLFWPNQAGLAGHSDGDVVAHAICDSLLSAARLGDVGSVFGTSDPRFANAHGETFLTETLRLVRAAGFEIGNVSVQVMGNRPIFSPRRTEAEALLSTLLEAPVSVAATTTDHLGFLGRGEGIAAISTALLTELRPN